MTACVNEEKKMKGGALSGKVARTFLAGALAVSMAPSVALADTVAQGDATSLSASTGANLEEILAGNTTQYRNTILTGIAPSESTFTGEGLTFTVSTGDDFTQNWPLAETVFKYELYCDGELVAWSGDGKNGTVTGEDIKDNGGKFDIVVPAAKADAGEYQLKWNSNYAGDSTGNVYGDTTGNVKCRVAAVDETGIDAVWDGEVIGWTGGDQTELASSHVIATFTKANDEVYTLVQGTEEEVEDGEADYWVTWNDTVVGSNDVDTTYKATLHYGGNFTGTETVTMTVYAADAATAVEDFNGGSVTKASDNAGSAVEAPFSFDYDRGVHYVVPEEVTTISGKVIDLDATDAKGNALYEVTYADAKGNPIANKADIKNAGDYKAVIKATTANAEYNGAKIEVGFTVEKAKLAAEDITVEDAYAPAFTWNGEDRMAAGVLDYVWDGEDLVETAEYTVEYYKVDTAKEDEVTEMVEPGEYVAKLTGAGNFEGTVEISVTISPMDLSKTALAVNDIALEDVDGIDNLEVFASFTKDGVADSVELNSDKKLVDLAITSGQKTITEKGSYTLAVTPDEQANEAVSFVTGEGEVSFAVVGEVVTDFQYKGTAFDEVENAVFNLDRGESLDASDIAVYDNDGKKLGSSEWTLTVTDLEGNVVTDWDKTAGDYIATVSVNYGSDYAMGGKASFAFSVTKGSLAEADVFVTFDGKVCGDKKFQFGNLYWNGADQSDRFGVKVVKDGKVLSEGDDYEWYFVDAEGERVDSLSAVGTYTLHVEGTGWAGSFDMVKNIEVAQLPVELSANGTKTFAMRASASVTGYPYTGDAVSPTFAWIEKTTDPYYDGLEGVLEEADYTVVYRDSENNVVAPEDLSEVGWYSAEIELTESGKAKFDLNADTQNVQTSTTVRFEIVDELYFKDVVANDWYAESVHKAWAYSFINGYNDGLTPLFGPKDNIKRGDVACILYNVASNATDADVDNVPVSSVVGTYSEFADVEVGVYWTAPINWAAKAGIVNGYGNDVFGPSDQVTREQVAAMLYNYAKAMGQDVAVEDEAAALAKVSDADTVSGWAKTAVAWAIENGVMGNGGYIAGQDTITRAEVAAMAVNFVEEFVYTA